MQRVATYILFMEAGTKSIHNKYRSAMLGAGAVREISPKSRERTAATPDSPGCSEEGSVDQWVMLDGKSVGFTFSIVAKLQLQLKQTLRR
jgi:hypothetical protein